MSKLYFIFIFVLLVSSCTPKQGMNSDIVDFTILYTNDEHGWMQGNNEHGGAAEMYEHWLTQENFDESDKFLVLSGGDTWSGPAISTWFKGKPMIQTMNAMDYDAAALGNHEFDAKVKNLNLLVSEAKFPFLAANIRYKSSGKIPNFVKPYVIIERQDVKIGIIGLASLSTPYTTFPDYVKDFEFTDYVPAVEKYAEIAKQKGAEVILIIGHICSNEMTTLIPVAKKVGAIFIGGAHCHQKFLQNTDNLVLMQVSSYLRRYGKMQFSFDKNTKIAKIISAEIVDNTKGEKNNKIAQIVDFWETKVDSSLADTIGYADANIASYSSKMANMLTDSWLIRFPKDNVSITNAGGIRQNIEKGYITRKEMVGVLPFNNNLIELRITGSQLVKAVSDFEIGGMTTIGGFRFTNGSIIYSDSIYGVVTTDYLYSVSKTNFSKFDPTAYNTSVQYRKPLIDWIISLKTSPDNPLNKYLDNKARH